LILWVALLGLVVFVELARRRVPVHLRHETSGIACDRRSRTHLPLKLNNAGLMPTIVAPWLLFLPLMFAGLVFGQTSPGWLPPTNRSRRPFGSYDPQSGCHHHPGLHLHRVCGRPEHAADS